jgi:hypothetical protein
MKTTAFMIALTIVAAGACGCSRSLSPELRGLGLSKGEAHNNYRVVSNQELRGVSDDLARMFYTDNPNRLTPYPISSIRSSI